MAFIREKKRGSRSHFFLIETIRNTEGKRHQRTIKYLGYSDSPASIKYTLISILPRARSWFGRVLRYFLRLSSNTRLRIIYGILASLSLIISSSITGTPRYLGFGITLYLILCVAFPRILKVSLELIGFGRNSIGDTADCGLALTIFKGLSVGLVGAVLPIYLIIKQTQPDDLGIGDFNVVVTALALGALMITAANSKRVYVNDRVRIKALMAGQKLVIAGITLALFTVFFMVYVSFDKTLGTTDPSVLDFSPDGWRRGLSFWLTELSLVGGGILFASGIIEIAFVLRDISIGHQAK